MNKKILLGTGLALTLVIAAGSYHQAFAVTDTSNAEATIVQAIDVDCSGSLLDFGNISASAASGVVTVTTAGVGSDDAAGATYIGGAAAGNCDVEGAALPADIAISGTLSVDDPGAGTPMALSNFTLSYNGGAAAAAPITATLVPAGAALLIGADLAVGANQLAGTYTGSFVVDVQYQ